MRRLRVIIVEDQAPAREHLTALVAESPLTDVVAVCHDGQSAVEAIRATPSDVVLLDIQMPELDGFQVIEAVGAANMPPVVFITAYDDHAFRACDVRALDYLLKPFTAKRVERALDLARAHVRDRLVSAAAGDLAVLVSGGEGAGARERVALGRRGEIVNVAIDEIEVVESERNDVRVFTRHDEFRQRSTLAGMRARLGESFAQVHRSRLVNIAQVAGTESLAHGGLTLRMAGGREVRVSKAFRSGIRKRLRTNGPQPPHNSGVQ